MRPSCLQEELADLSEQQVKHLYGHSGSITGLSYSTDQALLFSSSADGTVRLWSMQWCKNLAAYRCVVVVVVVWKKRVRGCERQVVPPSQCWQRWVMHTHML
jgi:WD40 repeat protein